MAIPCHFAENECHATVVGDSRKYQTGADERGNREKCRVNGPRQRHAQKNNRPRANTHLAFERNHLGRAAFDRKVYSFPSGHAAFDAVDMSETRFLKPLAGL